MQNPMSCWQNIFKVVTQVLQTALREHRIVPFASGKLKEIKSSENLVNLCHPIRSLNSGTPAFLCGAILVFIDKFILLR